MDFAMRLRRGGGIMTMAAALVLTACQDGFFFDPAAGYVTPVAVQWTLVERAASSVPPGSGGPVGVDGPQATPGAAFDKADGVHVVLRSGDTDLFNQRLPLQAQGTDKKVSFSVELPAGTTVSTTLQLTLLQGTTELFTGSASAALTPGQAAEVNVPLSGVVTAVALDEGPYVVRTLGGTLKLTARGLFATGDVVGSVAATFRALDPTVTVASDGTVTAVSNGSGRVEASYLGRADTAVVTVEDRCWGPFAPLGLGQSASGVLEANDCDDAGNFSYNDWYEVVLGTAMLVRATLTGDGFEPFVGVNQTDKTTLAVAASQDASVTTEFALPQGTYLVRAGSRARTAGPNPTGSYSLALGTASEPQQGCFAGSTSTGATWVVDGIVLGGRLAADDCALGGIRQDVYAGRMSSGDTAVVTVDGDFRYRLVYGPDARLAPSTGGRVQWAFTSDDERSHYVSLRTDAAGPFGNYLVHFDGGIPADYDACANPPILMGIGATATPQVKTGRLQKRIDCEGGDRIRDTYVVTTPSVAFRTTLESSDFAPFVAVTPRESRQGWGTSSDSGPATAEHVYALGESYLIRALPLERTSEGGRVEGAYTLSAEVVGLAQEGCRGHTFVDFGSVAAGRITSEDCEDEFDGDPEVMRRWDGYVILLQPGETVSVSVTPEFYGWLTHWVGGEFVQGTDLILPGGTGSLVVTNQAGVPVFHYFYPINEEHEATGDYVFSVSGTPSVAPAAVSGEGGGEMPALVPGETRGGGRPKR